MSWTVKQPRVRERRSLPSQGFHSSWGLKLEARTDKAGTRGILIPTSRELKEIPIKASSLSLIHRRNSTYICFFPSNCLEDSIAFPFSPLFSFWGFQAFLSSNKYRGQGKMNGCEASYKVVRNLKVSHFLPGDQWKKILLCHCSIFLETNVIKCINNCNHILWLLLLNL